MDSRVHQITTLKMFQTNKPKTISQEEWKDLIKNPIVRETWAIDDYGEKEFLKEGIEDVYGVKFDYAEVNTGGYVGDLFILHGGNVIDYPPVVLVRKKQTREIIGVQELLKSNSLN